MFKILAQINKLILTEFYQKWLRFSQSQEMATGNHWLSILCNYKSIRLLISDFRFQIS